ncbi:MAG: hypothetical protein ACREJM_06295 [Candidatus Saccharimonadales bacterium]
MPLSMTTDHECPGTYKSPGDSLWQIGEVVQELLDRYEIDLTEPPLRVAAFSVPDDALVAC